MRLMRSMTWPETTAVRPWFFILYQQFAGGSRVSETTLLD